MPVFNPPFPYFQSQQNDVLLFSSGHVSGNVNRGRGLNVEAAPGYDVSGNNYGGELYLRSGYGADSTTNLSQGGSFYIRAGRGGNAGFSSYGGDLLMYAGYAGNVAAYYATRGGTARLYGGNGGNADPATGESLGGRAYLYGGRAGTGLTSIGGSVYISGGNGQTKGGNVTIHAGSDGAGYGLVYLLDIPAADPGKSGALFTTAGVLHISP